MIVLPFTKVKPRGDEIGWLIESALPGPIKYWAGAPAQAGDAAWTGDHLDAVRFARKRDAQRASARLLLGATRVAEHAWTHRS